MDTSPVSHDPQGPAAGEKSFWGHIDDLRGMLFRMAVLVIGLMAGCFCIMRWFFDNVLLAPCRGDFPLYRWLSFISGDGDFMPNLGGSGFNLDLISYNLSSQFMTHMTASMWLAVVVAFPLLIWLLWRYLKPALYDKEIKVARGIFVSATLMFYIGAAVGYTVVFPLSLRFLSQYQLSEHITNHISLDSYMDTFYLIILALGIIFEMPVLAWLLGKAGMLHRNFFHKYRRHAILGLTVLAAIITPTGDVFTLTIVFVPLYTLWELSAFAVPKALPDDD